VKESFPPKVVSGLSDLGPKIAAGFFKHLVCPTVENFALRVIGNLWRLLAFCSHLTLFLFSLFPPIETKNTG
jgi:hypothetical protein